MIQRTWATVMLLVVLGTGCPTAADETQVVDVCAKTGQQCRMGGGKLGVCMIGTDGSYTCVSQH